MPLNKLSQNDVYSSSNVLPTPSNTFNTLSDWKKFTYKQGFFLLKCGALKGLS